MIALALAALLAWQDGSSVVIDGGARVTAQRTVTLTVRLAPSEAPPAEMALSPDGTQWSPWRPFAATTKYDLPEGDGEKTVHVRISDAAGKELPPLKAVILLDTTPPRPEVSAPAVVPGNLVTLTSNVPDAVAMQFAGEAGPWGEWVPYAKPRIIVLPPGEGRKIVQVRYRDEAGNVSAAAQVAIDVKPDAAPDDQPGVQDVRIVSAAEKEGAYSLRIDIAARGMTAVEVQVDGTVVYASADFEPTLELIVPKTGSSHRVSVLLRDGADTETVAELAFLEQGLPFQAPPVPESTSFLEVRLGAGLWMNGLSFDAATPRGRRELKSGSMGVLQLSLALNVLDPVYVELSGEYALGKDATITTFGADLGVRLVRGSLFELRAQAGVLLSTLTLDDPTFGDFDQGTGFRAGVSARVALSDHVAVDASLQYRSLTYKWSDALLSGDDKASAGGAALLLGLSWGF